MKMVITEKQLIGLLGKRKKEIDEEDTKSTVSTSSPSSSSSSSSSSTGPTTGASAPVSGPSSPDAADMETYKATKWEDVKSPISRGVANPVGPIKKHEDYPEANPVRGVANQLY